MPNKRRYRHSRESGNPDLLRRYWTPACAGVTIRGTFGHPLRLPKTGFGPSNTNEFHG
jgi:hypothetical protein